MNNEDIIKNIKESIKSLKISATNINPNIIGNNLLKAIKSLKKIYINNDNDIKSNIELIILDLQNGLKLNRSQIILYKDYLPHIVSKLNQLLLVLVNT